MRTNKTKAKLQQGQMAIGAMLQFQSPETVEIMGALGLDYVIFDLEHEPFNELDLVNSIRAAEAFDLTPIVRVPNDAMLILRLLDAGAQGVHIPEVNTARQAQAVVDAALFHPHGKRTFYATGRWGNYGFGITEEEFAERSNKETLVILQVEEDEGIRNYSDILAVPHVDVIQIGPKDLWQSMGMPDRQVVWEIVERSLVQAVEAGRWTSMVGWMSDRTQEQLARYRELGVRMITVLPRELMAYGARAFLQQANEVFGPLLQR